MLLFILFICFFRSFKVIPSYGGMDLLVIISTFWNILSRKQHDKVKENKIHSMFFVMYEKYRKTQQNNHDGQVNPREA